VDLQSGDMPLAWCELLVVNCREKKKEKKKKRKKEREQRKGEGKRRDWTDLQSSGRAVGSIPALFPVIRSAAHFFKGKGREDEEEGFVSSLKSRRA